MQGEEGGCAVLDSSQLKVVGLSWLDGSNPYWVPFCGRYCKMYCTEVGCTSCCGEVVSETLYCLEHKTFKKTAAERLRLIKGSPRLIGD